MKLKFWNREREKLSSDGFRDAYAAAVRQRIGLYRNYEAEATSAAQFCIGLWQGSLAGADVSGVPLDVDAPVLSFIGRSLAIRGEAVALITAEGLTPVRIVGQSRAGDVFEVQFGEQRRRALRDELLIITLPTADPTRAVIDAGRSPLQRAGLSADVLAAVERSVAASFGGAGARLVSLSDTLQSETRDQVVAAAGQAGRLIAVSSPETDEVAYNVTDLTPKLGEAQAVQQIEQARASICAAFGVLPTLMNATAAGEALKEALRQFRVVTAEPLARIIEAELKMKLASTANVSLDHLRSGESEALRGRLVKTLTEAGVSLEDALAKAGLAA